VINALPPASSYFDGALRAVRAADPAASAVCVLQGLTGFGQDVASDATSTARDLWGLRGPSVVPFEPGHAAQAAATLAPADLLLVVGGFEDEVAAA